MSGKIIQFIFSCNVYWFRENLGQSVKAINLADKWREKEKRCIPSGYIRIVRDMYKGYGQSTSTVCGEAIEFLVVVGSHQDSALGHLFIYLGYWQLNCTVELKFLGVCCSQMIGHAKRQERDKAKTLERRFSKWVEN